MKLPNLTFILFLDEHIIKKKYCTWKKYWWMENIPQLVAFAAI